jgi:hypothetical protein
LTQRKAEDAVTELAEPDAGHCLNCGRALHGAFCATCGQRSVPSDPTLSELAGDAWHELSGYDGRIASTFRSLFRPGKLTLEYLQGRRARYLPPVRLYLIVSVIYFLVAAAAPESAGGLRTGVQQEEMLTEEDRAGRRSHCRVAVVPAAHAAIDE